MAECKDCVHFCVCSPYTTPNESYPEVDGCKCFRATADVVPKSEVERLNAELVRDRARHPFAMTLFELEACEKHAAIEAVKEVWRELRSNCDAPHWCVWLSEIDDYFEKKTGVKTEDIAELKKKYTENENG